MPARALQHEVARALAESTTGEEALRRTVAALAARLGCAWGAVWAVDRGRGELRLSQCVAAPKGGLQELEALSRGLRLAPGSDLPGRAWTSGRLELADGMGHADPARAAAAAAAGLTRGLALPVGGEGEVLAVLELLGCGGDLEPELLDAIAALAGQLGQFLERKQAEDERDRFFTLSLDLLCIAGLDGYFKRLNPAFERVLGWSTEELLARPFLDFVHPHDIEATLGEMSRLGTGAQTISFENRYRTRDGSWKWMLWNATPVVESGRIFAAARDITDRKRAEAALAQVAETERRAREAVEQAQARLVQSEKLAALGQMVAGVAHEINNPLAYVSNNLACLSADLRPLTRLLGLYAEAEPLLGRSDPGLLARIGELRREEQLGPGLEPFHDLLARSRDGLRRIHGIVQDLRDFARLDSGGFQEGVDLNPGIESTLNIVRGRARKAGVELATDLRPLPAITCAPAKVNQVVLNLVANAIDACPETGRVEVASRPAEGGVEIVVADDGRGIDPAHASRLFDPFFTTKPPGQGTGLGLSISYGIVEEHGGRIGFRSEPGKGTRFTVWLPLRPGPRPGAEGGAGRSGP